MTKIYGPGAEDLDRAARILAEGGIIAVPTETVYGLAAHALDEAACGRIFEIKGRPLIDPLIIHIHDLIGAKSLAAWNDWAELLAHAFWPGPLTFVLPKQSIVPALVTAGLETVAIRMPRHPVMRKLLIKCNLPLAAPSANPFGYLSPTRPEHVLEALGENLEFILDGGPCEIGLESTVLDLCDPLGPAILRPGAISGWQISEVLGIEILVKTQSMPEIPAPVSKGMPSPGLMHRHYSPRTPLAIRPHLHEFCRDEALTNEKIAFIAFQKPTERPDFTDSAAKIRFFWLTEDGDVEEAARNLYDLLHKVDRMNFNQIFIELAPESGLGAVINERLLRASGSAND